MKIHQALTLFLIPNLILTVEIQKWPTQIVISLLSSDLTVKNGNKEVDNLYDLIANETLKDLIEDEVVPNDARVKIFTYPLKSCDDANSVEAFLLSWQQNNPDVFFGPECSEGMTVVGLLASNLNIPIFDYFSISHVLSNSKKYRTMIRFYYTMEYMSQAINIVVKEFGWTSLAIIRTDSAESCNLYLSGIYDEFGKSNVIVVNDLSIDLKDKASVENGLEIIQRTARIILLCSGPSPANAQQFLKIAKDYNMLNEEYAYIIPEYKKINAEPWEPWLRIPRASSQESESSKNLYVNSIIIRPDDDISVTYSNYTKRLQNLLMSKYQTQIQYDDLLLSFIPLAPLRDAIYMYFKTVNKSIENGQNFEDGLNIFKDLADNEFYGVTGRITFDDNAERVPDFEVLKSNSDKEFGQVLKLGQNSSHDHEIQVISKTKTPHWGTVDNTPPKTEPICGFLNEHCQPTSYTLVYVIVPIVVALLLLFGSMGTYIYKKTMFEKKLLESSWKIDMNEFHIITTNNSVYSHVSKLQSERSSLRNDDVMKFNQVNSDVNGTFEGCAIYKDMLVAVKRWPKQNNTSLTQKHILLLQTIRSINHENLNRFVGLTLDSNNKVTCLWAYCTKHSLQDIIYNDELHLDMAFKVSILRDVASGLEYLHGTKIGFHGRLFLTNCLIDSRWVVKITDYGIFRIVEEMCNTNNNNDKLKIEKFLCTPPECLRNIPVSDPKSLDIYSFGMVAYQVLRREEPFAELNKSNEEILAMLQNPYLPPLRPSISIIEGCDARILNLIGKCLNSESTLRPPIGDVKKEIFMATKNFGKNLLDHAMSMLEKYATNLENIVAERTLQLNDERKRADKLLYQMLPKTVADCLKSGQAVVPETFDCATVYFSDIVGFTNICSRSLPVEVVAMLNLLYSKFDEIILEFKAFKVETIGDAYLVVSGIPVRNGMQHVVNIADMSLKIQQVLSEYVIPHLPEQKLLVRIGLNSGPVASGVVGLTMPRYCLFGDTVNFASRMESTGEGGKIHISESTRNLLTARDEYVIEKRGEIEVKGKGLHTTFWLIKKK